MYGLLVLARLILGLLLVFFGIEHSAALDAPSCFVEPTAQNCYPWGMKEGPMEGGSWSYANKEVYVATGAAFLWIIGAAFVASFLFEEPSLGFGALVLGCLICAILVRPGSLLFPQGWLDAAEQRYEAEIKASRERRLDRGQPSP